MSDKKTYLFTTRKPGDPPRERVVIDVPADPTIQPYTFDDSSPNLFPNSDANHQAALLAGIMPFLKIDQKDMVEEYAALHQKCLNGTEPDQGPRLIDFMFVFMTEQLRLALQMDRGAIDRRIREGLVVGGLVDLYYDIVMREGFLLEHPVRLLRSVHTVSALIRLHTGCRRGHIRHNGRVLRLWTREHAYG